VYKKSVSNYIHVIPLRQEGAKPRKTPDKTGGIGDTLEDGFFRTLLDDMQTAVIVLNSGGKPGEFGPGHHGTMFPDRDLRSYLTRNRRAFPGRSTISLKEAHNRP
jgi:hypothetical protein